MRLPKLRELKEAITAVLRGPYTARFPAEPTPLPEAFRGQPVFDEDECVGCGACYEACPPDAMDLVDDVEAGVRRITIHLDRCIFCGQCEANCITEKGIKLSNHYDLATTDRGELRESVEKALLICESCGEVIGPRDHVRWVAERLGPLGFANPTLLLTAMEDLDAAGGVPTPSAHLRRGDKLRITCPKCRQVTSLLA